MRLLCMDVPSKMVRLGLTQIDLIIQIYYFLCGFCDFCERLLNLAAVAGRIAIHYCPRKILTLQIPIKKGTLD